MARVSPERREEILAAIRVHLINVGPHGFDALHAKFPEISRPTFYRWLKDIRESNDVELPRGALATTQKRIKEVIETVEKTTEKVSKHLPTAPSPAIVAAKGDDAVVNISFMGRLESLYRDAEMIRAFSVTTAEDGSEKIKNPLYFISSIKQRKELLDTALHAMAEVYELQRIQQMYDMILAEIGKEDPELQKRILERLRELNNRHGLTIEARVS